MGIVNYRILEKKKFGVFIRNHSLFFSLLYKSKMNRDVDLMKFKTRLYDVLFQIRITE